jgi:hypothetical protein
MSDTEFRRSFPGHADIAVAMRPEFAGGADWLLGYFENEIRKGVVFRADQTVQIGWSIVLLKPSADGTLELFEPRLGAMPIAWVRGANGTYRQLMLQNEICRRMGVEPDYPSMLQSGVVSPDFFACGGKFEMSRDPPQGNDSGWVFREAGYAGSEGRLCSLFEIASAVPQVLMLLPLPAGASAASDGRGVKMSCGAKTLSSDNDDFLKSLFAP